MSKRSKKCRTKKLNREKKTETIGMEIDSPFITQNMTQNISMQSQDSGITSSVIRTMHTDSDGITRCSCGGCIWEIVDEYGQSRLICGDCGYDNY